LSFSAKQVEILKETFPDRTRLTALWDRLSADQMDGAERAAKLLQLGLLAIKLENPPYNIPAIFRRMLFGPEREVAETAQADHARDDTSGCHSGIPTITGGIGQFAAIQSVAPSVGVEVSPVNVRDADERPRPAERFVNPHGHNGNRSE
jgi:hypothetical protein